MASSYTASWDAFWGGPEGKETLELTYAVTCHTDGSMTAISTDADLTQDGQTYTQLIRGRSLRSVEAYPGSPAPDAADITVSDAAGLDLLNGNGTSLISATLAVANYPLIDDLGATIPIRGVLSIALANQTTNGAKFTLKLTFE